MTNFEKFVEVFGFEPDTTTCIEYVPDMYPACIEHHPTCEGCEKQKWWYKEYKEKAQ